MISTFMAQINSLQTELRQLAHAQSQTQDLVSQKERSLEKERKMKDEFRRKYKVCVDMGLVFVSLMRHLF